MDLFKLPWAYINISLFMMKSTMFKFKFKITRKWTTSDYAYLWKRWHCEWFGSGRERCTKKVQNASNHTSNCKGDLCSSYVCVRLYLSASSIKMLEEAAPTGTHFSNLFTLTRVAAYVIRQCRSTHNRCGAKYNMYFIANV